ncbi:hypothetical protein GBAR_LOCUS15308 [Geodia barretti]|uniref:Uncharacterized protein n=1 Tax=Geodia barretti TaxID=519541 RepID=A0AA35WM96_GEOBA|nr:hypothetical protein GBAR_LOCUS15308 [Geodia barretti]
MVTSECVRFKRILESQLKPLVSDTYKFSSPSISSSLTVSM